MTTTLVFAIIKDSFSLYWIVDWFACRSVSNYVSIRLSHRLYLSCCRNTRSIGSKTGKTLMRGSWTRMPLWWIITWYLFIFWQHDSISLLELDLDTGRDSSWLGQWDWGYGGSGLKFSKLVHDMGSCLLRAWPCLYYFFRILAILD